MSDLIKFIDRKLALIQELEDNDGEISPKSEGEMDVINAHIRENADTFVDYRQSIDASIEKYKAAIATFVAVQEKKKTRLDDFLKFAIGKIGKIETPFSSINVQSREFESILVTDFDKCAKAYPDSVTIKDFDNMRTLTISKKYLKGKEPIGFIESSKESSWIVARQRAGNKIKQGEITNDR